MAKILLKPLLLRFNRLQSRGTIAKTVEVVQTSVRILFCQRFPTFPEPKLAQPLAVNFPLDLPSASIFMACLKVPLAAPNQITTRIVLLSHPVDTIAATATNHGQILTTRL